MKKKMKKTLKSLVKQKQYFFYSSHFILASDFDVAIDSSHCNKPNRQGWDVGAIESSYLSVFE